MPLLVAAIKGIRGKSAFKKKLTAKVPRKHKSSRKFGRLAGMKRNKFYKRKSKK